MIKRSLVWVLLLLFAFEGQAQYRAIFSGGRAYLSDNNKSVKIQNGQLINADSQIELVGEALVILMDGAGRLTTLSLAGKYELENLKAPESADSALFVKSVWDTYYQNFGKQTVATDILEQEGAASSWTSFELLIPSSSQFYSNELMLQWSDIKESRYSVEMINEFGEVFNTFAVSKAAAQVNLADGNLAWKDEVTFRVKAGSSEKRTALYSLDRLAPPDYEKLERLINENFTEEGFEMKLTKAAFFENQWLFADAITILYQLRQEWGSFMGNYWRQYLLRNGFYYSSKP
jgi:hypothetical protein